MQRLPLLLLPKPQRSCFNCRWVWNPKSGANALNSAAGDYQGTDPTTWGKQYKAWQGPGGGLKTDDDQIDGVGVTVTGRVEHLVAPLGIATLDPRYSWHFSGGGRNVTQVSYHLRVTDDQRASVCSSGEVASAASNLVTCSHGSSVQRLEPGRVYLWTVDARLSDGSMASMPPQRFSTGLQTRTDWDPSAEFIGLPQKVKTAAGKEVVCPWLRKSFTATHAQVGAATALLSVASVGWHEVYVNGVKLEEASVLIPSVSDMHRRVLSHQYDVAGHLREGSNTLAFWAAPGWSQLTWPNKGGESNTAGTSYNISAAPLVMAQLSVCSGECSMLVTTSASSGWKARPSNLEHTGSWQWGNYGGERLDQTLSVLDWSTTAPTTGWVDAAPTVVDRQVTPESLEAMSAVETLAATGVAPCAKGAAGGSCFVVSFPRLFNGFFSAAALPGLAAGETVTFTYSANCLSPCPAARPYMPCAPPTTGAGVCTSAATEWVAVDTLVAGSGANGTAFENRFNWHTFQFVVIQANSTTLKLADADLGGFVGKRITNAQTKIGSFRSSSPKFDQVYEAFVQTYEGLTVSGMQVDCTNRERLGYGGDAHSRIEFAMDTYSSHALYSKWMVDWADTQAVGAIDDTEKPHVFGNVPNTAPTYSGAGSPMWGGITVLLPYELYRRYGDMRMLVTAYPTMKNWLEFMIHFSHNTIDGLVHQAVFDWLGDWQAPHGCSDGNDPDLYNNAYIVYALRRAVEIVRAINDPAISADAAKFATAADSIGAAVHTAFFRASSSRYGPTSPPTAAARQGHQVFPLVAGLTPKQSVPAVLAALVDELTNTSRVAKGHIDTGLTTTYLMGKLLSGGMEGLAGADSDRPDLIYSATMNPTWPSYSALIDAGLTTWPETWVSRGACIACLGTLLTSPVHRRLATLLAECPRCTEPSTGLG